LPPPPSDFDSFASYSYSSAYARNKNKNKKYAVKFESKVKEGTPFYLNRNKNSSSLMEEEIGSEAPSHRGRRN